MKLRLPTIRVPRFTSKFVTASLATLALALFAAAGWGWWHYLRSNPERVFWAAISNALQTHSVSRQMARDTGTNQPDQFLRLHTSPTPGVTGINKYYQSGDRDEPNLITETIGTPQADFVRVLELRSTETGQSPPDLKSVQNVWANATNEGAGQTNGQLYNQFALAIVPFGNLDQKQKAEIMSKMRSTDVYSFSAREAQRLIENGRPVYVYNVNVNTQNYVAALKQFATYSGINQLEGINPEEYKDAPPLRFQFVIDVWSRQLVATRQAGGPTTRFHSYGIVAPPITPPKETIPLEELQKRLGEVR